MAVLDVTQKTQIYHTLYRLNHSFAAIVGYCQTLQETGLLKPKLTRLFQAFTQELQGEINSDALIVLHGREEHDWARFGKVRDKWEKYLRGPAPKTVQLTKPRNKASR